MSEVSSLELAYIGAGCNKSPQIMDWNKSNLICFGSCNSVAVYNPTLGKIVGNLVKHTDKVTCVKWTKGLNADKNELISGSDDSKVFVWSLEFTSKLLIKHCFELVGHTASILSVDGLYRGNSSETLIASAASDNTIRIWSKSTEDIAFTCCKTIQTGLSFALCLNMTLLTSNTVLLAVGTDFTEMLLYTVGQNDSEINYLTKTIGHEDWIRSIDIAVLDDGDILIASSSQDMMVRISRLSKTNNDLTSEAFSLKKEEVTLGSSSYFLSLETVLFGHEGWVYSVAWSPFLCAEKLSLLTASFDRTLIVWKPCPDSGVWLEEARMGELGGDNTLGYYGAKFSPDGSSVLAHSYQGSFHLWQKLGNKWIAEYVIGGHSDAVTDITWDIKGRYVVSVSSDKSSRLHAPCLKGIKFNNKPWCELSRPQIHGHALFSATSLSNLGFASCSEEKVIRVFSPSYDVLKLVNFFCDGAFEREKEGWDYTLPSSASITALGLSNQANFESTEKNYSSSFENLLYNGITPNEDYLAQNTLWPEVMKLYGHGNDVFCITASHDGKVLASASKATSADQAKIILWDTLTWNIIRKLEGHQLTVTQMEFSPDDIYLLSVSRDRKWCLFKKDEGLVATSQKGKVMHSRIIWSCSWSHDGIYFVTGSRDCKVIVWSRELEDPVSNMISEDGSVTAVSFGAIPIETDKYVLAVGHDTGKILIFSWSLKEWSLLQSVPTEIGHHLTVQRLRFRPLIGRTEQPSEEDRTLQLASCSADYSVRVYNISINS